MNMSKKSKQKRTTYNLKFKQDAAKLVIDKGYTHQQTADNLGVSLSTIRRWVKEEEGPIVEIKSIPSLSDQAELMRLRLPLLYRHRQQHLILIPINSNSNRLIKKQGKKTLIVARMEQT